MAGLSVRQFERNFLSTFRTTPKHYMMRLRVLLACDQLLETRRSITEIALGVGFCDHSAFARHFRKQMGLSPRAYREKYLATPTPNRRSSLTTRRPSVKRAP
jgi:transcriptional regulator GlxA family with amidase domain